MGSNDDSIIYNTLELILSDISDDTVNSLCKLILEKNDILANGRIRNCHEICSY